LGNGALLDETREEERCPVLMTRPQPSPSEVSVAPSFDDFFRTHYARVYGLLYRVTGHAEDADDLAQEVFLQLYRREPPIWQDPGAEGWLWRAASHTALNALRDARRRRQREERVFQQERSLHLVAEHEEDPATSLERRAQQAAVREALRQLKPQEGQLLLLRHAGLSYAEVAQALDLNPASVGTLLRRAEARFKSKFPHQLYPDATTNPGAKEKFND
jgi:RNA polymerase sigma-70 factor, ECF subfamily